MQAKQKVWVSIILFATTIIVNFFGGTGRINGLSQGEVSDRYWTLITPAGMTFSIWGVIYTLLGIALVILLWKHQEEYYREVIEKTSYLFWMTCLLNMAWIVSFSYLQIGLSTLFILGYVVLLSIICQQLLSVHQTGKWFLPATFGLYTGWLFIATVVNIAAYLVQIDWNGFGLSDSTWAIIMLIVALVLVVGVVTRLKNPAFPLSIAWAYWGIYQSLIGLQLEVTIVEWTALMGMFVLIGLAAITFYYNRKLFLPTNT